MGTKNLTLNQKARWTPNILDQYYPNGEVPTCLFCKQEFIENDDLYCKEWDHLNNNSQDNRPENLCWAHAICNERKKHSPEWQVIAMDQLKKNVRRSESLGGGGGERAKTAHTERQPNEQIDANSDGLQESEKYLTERLLPSVTGNPAPESKLDWTKTEDNLSYICYKKYGHGSQKTLRYYLKMLTSDHAPFDTITENGRIYIIRRAGN